MLLRRAYSMGLALYPPDFRAQFGGEMATVFEQAATQLHGGGEARVILFFVKEMLSLVAGAARQRISHDDAIRWHPPSPLDVAGTERSLGVVSRRLTDAIARHDFASARYYDQLDRRLRASLAQLRTEPS